MLYNSELQSFTSLSLHFDSVYLSNDKTNITYTGESTPCDKGGYNSNFFRIAIVPSLFFLSGALTWESREAIHDFRNRYLPNFHNNYDDYLQYGPTAVVYGLNIAGVKGRHKMGRATLNYAYSNAIMSLIVNSLKHTTNVLRPDQSSYNSFPSGHTATAFVAATFLHKEYGQCLDSRYSMLGYAMAIGTGIGRQTNNRHWISDVLVGAGIGILSTELGYLLSKKIHNNIGEREGERFHYYNPYHKPSFFQLKLGTAFSVGHKADNGIRVKLSPGNAMGAEGAWFINKYLGVGGQVSFISYSFSMSGADVGDDLYSDYFFDDLYFQSMGTAYYLAGPYFNYALNNYWSLTGKVNAGISEGAHGVATSMVKDSYQTIFGNEQVVLKFDHGKSFAMAAGIGISREISRTVRVKGYMEYYYSNPYIYIEEIDNCDLNTGTVFFEPEIKYGKQNSNSLVLGISLAVVL